MKRANKYLSLALALIMALSLCVTSFAATITVETALEGETYTAYKIFNYTKDGTNYAYTMDANSPWKTVVDAYTYGDPAVDVFTLTPSKSDANILVVTVASVFTAESTREAAAKDFAEYLADADVTVADTETAIKQTVVANEEGAVFTDLAQGYWFVDTTLGALCSLINSGDDVKVLEKNEIPTISKTENKTEAAIGDTVQYTIVVTDKKGTDKEIIVHDTMEAGLSFTADKANFTVTATEEITENDWSVAAATDGCSFHITLNADYVTKMDENDTVTFVYNAVLNANAEIYDVANKATNDNTAKLEYSEQETTPVTVKVATYKFALQKTNGSAQISGAKFKLFDAETGGNEIAVVKVSDGIYRVAMTGETGVEIEVGSATIQGLDNKVYYLEETKAPDGYNMLTSRVAVDAGVTVDEATEVDLSVEVVNRAGGILPGTGGVGTTMFYVLGSVMMIGAAVLLVTKKKMANEQ